MGKVLDLDCNANYSHDEVPSIPAHWKQSELWRGREARQSLHLPTVLVGGGGSQWAASVRLNVPVPGTGDALPRVYSGESFTTITRTRTEA